MPQVKVKENESFEKTLRRFKKKCNKEGIMRKIKESKYYEKPSEKRRRKLQRSLAKISQY